MKSASLNSPAYEALVRLPVVREYEAAFSATTNLSLKLLPRGPRTQSTSPGAWENPFCALTARSAGGCAACLEAQTKIERRLRRKRVPHSVICFAGLTDVAVPVVVDGQHVATWWSGQLFQRKPTLTQFDRLRGRLIEWGLGQALRRIEAAYFHTPIVPKERLHAIVRLLSLFADHLAAYANRSLFAQRIDEPPRITEATRFAQLYAGESLTMRHAAQHVNLSPAYFCKLFRKATGVTFTDYVARIRIEKAKNLLADPWLRVTDVAERAGFQSISQFNRVFRRHAETSPTAYRVALRRRSKSARRKPIRA